MDKGKIIIIEGTSCVGKTTLCNSLKKEGWIILPEAIRYLEKETGKIGDEASPIPDSQAEEEYYQDQLFRVEKQKIIEANELRKKGQKVIIDKSSVAIIATAKAFENSKKFKGTFKRAYLKYCELLQDLKKNELIECDIFMLLTADYNTINNRNITRNHILEGIWIDESTILSQREVLEKIASQIVGNISENNVKSVTLDTTDLTQKEVLHTFHKILNNLEKNEFEIE